MSTKMTETDWENALEVFPRLPAAAGPQGGGRPAVSGSDALFHGGECALACVAGTLRPLELGVEAL